MALRYDQTVPFARVVAQHRTSRPSGATSSSASGRGRTPARGGSGSSPRETWTWPGRGHGGGRQTLAIASAGYRAIGFPRLRILVNDRTLFDQLGLSKPEVIAVDKLAKIGADGVVQKLVQLGRAESEARDLLERLREDRPGRAWKRCWPPPWTQDARRGPRTIPPGPRAAVLHQHRAGGDLAGLHRRLAGGGGRYDGLIRRFTGQDVPAVGFSFGLERVTEALEAVGAFQDFRPPRWCVALGQALGWAGQVAAGLRAAGVSVAMGSRPGRRGGEADRGGGEAGGPLRHPRRGRGGRGPAGHPEGPGRRGAGDPGPGRPPAPPAGGVAASFQGESVRGDATSVR